MQRDRDAARGVGGRQRPGARRRPAPSGECRAARCTRAAAATAARSSSGPPVDRRRARRPRSSAPPRPDAHRRGGRSAALNASAGSARSSAGPNGASHAPSVSALRPCAARRDATDHSSRPARAASPSRDGVAQRVVELAVRGVPIGRPAVDGALELGLAPPEIGAQRLGAAAGGSGTSSRSDRRPRSGRRRRRAARAPPPSRATSSTASHSGAVSRPRTDVRRRKATASSDRSPSTSLRTYSAISRSPPLRWAAASADSSCSWIERAARYRRGRPSLRHSEEPIDLPGVEPAPRGVDEHRGLKARHRELARAELGQQAMGAQPRDGHRERRREATARHDAGRQLGRRDRSPGASTPARRAGVRRRRR